VDDGEEEYTEVQVALRYVRRVQAGAEEQSPCHKCKKADLARPEDVQKPTASIHSPPGQLLPITKPISAAEACTYNCETHFVKAATRWAEAGISIGAKVNIQVNPDPDYHWTNSPMSRLGRMTFHLDYGQLSLGLRKEFMWTNAHVSSGIRPKSKVLRPASHVD
jgi:hypothetical protein